MFGRKSTIDGIPHPGNSDGVQVDYAVKNLPWFLLQRNPIFNGTKIIPNMWNTCWLYPRKYNSILLKNIKLMLQIFNYDGCHARTIIQVCEDPNIMKVHTNKSRIYSYQHQLIKFFEKVTRYSL